MRDRKADNLIRRQLRLEQCAWANRRVMIVKSSTLPILAHRCSGPAPSYTAAIAPRYVGQAAVHEPRRSDGGRSTVISSRSLRASRRPAGRARKG